MGYSLQPHIRRQRGPSKSHTRLRQVSEAGLRFYSPSLGRWLSRDPLNDEAFLLEYYRDENRVALWLAELAKPLRKGARLIRALYDRKRDLREKSRGHAYAFVSNEPLRHHDARGLFRYGNWCGPGWTGGKEKSTGDFDWINEWPYLLPIDDLDECCARHDACFAGRKWPVDPDELPWLEPDIKKCDAALCECAKNASSGGSARNQIIVAFCCIKPHG